MKFKIFKPKKHKIKQNFQSVLNKLKLGTNALVNLYNKFTKTIFRPKTLYASIYGQDSKSFIDNQKCKDSSGVLKTILTGSLPIVVNVFHTSTYQLISISKFPNNENLGVGIRETYSITSKSISHE
jgi:hypothetical protein